MVVVYQTIFFPFFFLVVLEFELSAYVLASQHSTAPVLSYSGYFGDSFTFSHRLDQMEILLL
jgi:hypothetical protein